MPGAALLLLLACAGAAEPPAPAGPSTKAEKTPVIETIEETTVGDLDGVRVPMGNMTEGAYNLPDGTQKRGLICSLALPGQTGVFVGQGSVVEVDGARWEVLSVEKTPGALGSVTLKKLD